MKEGDILRGVEDALRGLLGEVPWLGEAIFQRGPAAGAFRPDLMVRVPAASGEVLFVVEVKSSGEPRNVRAALNQIARYRASWPDAVFVIGAPYVSPASAGLCRQEGVGTIDLAGNARLASEGLYVRLEGRGDHPARRRPLRTLYSPKAARVVRTLLLHPRRSWRVTELASAAGVSLGLASNVKRLLEDREWVLGEATGLVLVEPISLIQEWAESYNRQGRRMASFYCMAEPSRIEASLADACRAEGLRFALKDFSAASRWAPFVRQTKVSAFVDREIDAVARRLDLKQVSSGANVSLTVPEDDAVFLGAEERDGIPIVAPVQAALDLWSDPGRGREAAEAIIEEVIRPQW